MRELRVRGDHNRAKFLQQQLEQAQIGLT